VTASEEGSCSVELTLTLNDVEKVLVLSKTLFHLCVKKLETQEEFSATIPVFLLDIGSLVG
jgi:hypothetical protein